MKSKTRLRYVTDPESGNKGRYRHTEHGAYANLNSRLLDGRTRLAKARNQIEAKLTADLGGEPSAAQLLLLQRTAVIAVQCRLIEIELLRKLGKVPETSLKTYLRLVQQLRSNLQVLGMERQARPISLQDYLDGDGHKDGDV
jgi:hypothetical protein